MWEASVKLDDAFVISFPNASSAEANRMAASLTESLREVDPTITADRLRDRSDTQDFGATVAVLLGTAAATAVAKGIAAALAKWGPAKITISQRGEVIASGLESKDAARIAEVISRRK